MVRILAAGEWHEPAAPSSMYEDDFEQLVLGYADDLFPDYHAVPFKPLVTSDFDSARPDLALVERHYREWWVVEIEMGYHSLGSHVLPQVRTLSQALYAEPEAKCICDGARGLDSAAVRDMMKGVQPNVLVIVNEHKAEWERDLSRYGARMVTVEVFRSDRNHHVLRVEGDIPRPEGNVISRCYLEPGLPRLLAIESPGGLGIAPHGRVKLRYQGWITEWERVDARDRVWLNPVAKNPLQANTAYRLTWHGDNFFEIRPE